MYSNWNEKVYFYYIQGIGTDEEGLLEILCTRSPKALANITSTYKERKLQHFKDIIKDTIIYIAAIPS